MADDLETELAETLAAVTADLDAQGRRMNELAGELCQSLEAVATAAYDEFRALAERVDGYADQLEQALAERRGVPDVPAAMTAVELRLVSDPEFCAEMTAAAREPGDPFDFGVPPDPLDEDAVLAEVQAQLSRAAAAKATAVAEARRQLLRDTALMTRIEYSRQHPDALRRRDRSGAPRVD